MKLKEINITEFFESLKITLEKKNEYKNFKSFLSDIGLEYEGSSGKKQAEKFLSDFVDIEKYLRSQKILVTLKKDIDLKNIEMNRNNKYSYYLKNLLLNLFSLSILKKGRSRPYLIMSVNNIINDSGLKLKSISDDILSIQEKYIFEREFEMINYNYTLLLRNRLNYVLENLKIEGLNIEKTYKINNSMVVSQKNCMLINSFKKSILKEMKYENEADIFINNKQNSFYDELNKVISEDLFDDQFEVYKIYSVYKINIDFDKFEINKYLLDQKDEKNFISNLKELFLDTVKNKLMKKYSENSIYKNLDSYFPDNIETIIDYLLEKRSDIRSSQHQRDKKIRKKISENLKS